MSGRELRVTGVLIVGAGIAGLTTALSLHAAGWRDVRLVEVAESLRPVGAGINVLPNAVRELAALGLLERLSRAAVSTAELRYYHRCGDLILIEPRGVEAGYRWPQLSIHRGPLQAILLDAVRERLGSSVLTTGLRLLDLDQRPAGGWEATFQHTSGERCTAGADIVIGADGIRSTVRRTLHPDHGVLGHHGMTMWRGTTFAPPFAGGRSMFVAGDELYKAVVYPLTTTTDPDGRVLVNWVLIGPATDNGHVSDWNSPVSPSKFIDLFTGWHFAGVDVPDLVRASNKVLEYPMVDITPLPTWSVSTATLVGDAAHAMVPMGSNGATQSIVDARALAFHLSTAEDPLDGLVAYERLRRPVTTRIQQANRQSGPEAVINLMHRAAPHGFAATRSPVSRQVLLEVTQRYAEIGEFDIASVNAGSPFEHFRPAE